MSFSQESEREVSVARSQTWDKAIGDDEKKSYGDISAQLRRELRVEFRNLLLQQQILVTQGLAIQ